jgi:hypothetical protein
MFGAAQYHPADGGRPGHQRDHARQRPQRIGGVALLNLLADLEDFLADCPHGALTADATPPAWNGYLLTVACSCGVVFERWVTPEDADADLVRIARLN